VPAFLIPIVSAIGAALGGAAGAFLVMYAVEIAGALMLIGGLALSSAQQRKAKRAAKDAYNASQVDRLANVVATVAPRHLVLGRGRKGGGVFFQGSAGSDKEIFCMAIALAGHEIDAVEAVYFNDVEVTLDGAGNVISAPYLIVKRLSGVASANGAGDAVLAHLPIAGTVTAVDPTAYGGDSWDGVPPVVVTPDGLNVASGIPYAKIQYQYEESSPKAQVWWYLGGADQAADARLMALFPELWTPAHRARGVAYAVVEFRYDETSFPSGVPNVTFKLRGAKVYDPRTGLTAWSENPALLLRHVYQHPHFGKATVSAAEDARIIAAANACDTAHAYVVDGVAEVRPLYQAAIVGMYGGAAKDLLDDLSQAMGGMWAFAGGELYVRAGVYTASEITLTDADLAVVQRQGESVQQLPIAISTHRERAQKYNVVNVRVWDAAQDYKQAVLAPLKGAALIARDGAELAQEVSLMGVGYAPQALHIAGIMMRDARDPLTVRLPFKLRAYPVELFSTVTLTLDRYGWSAKPFIVLGREWAIGGAIQLTLKETSAAIYTPDAGFLATGFARNTALPAPWSVPTVGPITVVSGAAEALRQPGGGYLSRIRVSWPALTDFSITQNGQVEVQYRDAIESDEWQSVTVAGLENQVLLANVEPGRVYVVRARARSTLAVGNWSLQVVHVVNPPTVPPPNIIDLSIAGLRLNWSPVQAFGLAGYVFRIQYGNNLDWGSATPLHTGIVTSAPFDLQVRPGGLVTIMGKAIDTAGTMSVGTGNVIVNMGEPPIGNIFETLDLQAEGYPGIITGGAVSAGDLVASELGSFYGPVSQSFYGPGDEPFYKANGYDQLVYTTRELILSVVRPGSLLALDLDAQGVDLTVEYRFNSPAPLYPSADVDSFYPADDGASFYPPPGPWVAWPGQLVAEPGAYQLRISLGSGATPGTIGTCSLIVDAPDIIEYLEDVAVSAAGTVVPYTSDFAGIRTVTVTLQANASGAVTVEADKTVNLAPVIKAYNAAHVAVSGATVDIIVKGF
jgi:hypothetical protein